MIREIDIKKFMAHSEIKVSNIPNINVIIGQNDAGKTGILKLLYSVAKSLEIYTKKKKNTPSLPLSYRKELAEKLHDTFMPHKNRLGDLVQKGSNDKLEVEVYFDVPKQNYQQPINFSFGERTESTIANGIESNVRPIPYDKEKEVEIMNTLFVPAKEVLSAFNDIRLSRNNLYGRGFDDTYLDLINALDIPTQKGNLISQLKSTNDTLEQLFEGKISQTKIPDQPFIFQKGKQQFSISLTAEGIKKIGILTTLINNRQLRKGTILFMDEPETALHPQAIRKLVELLVEMSKADIQVFLATHSYFVLKQLAISAKLNEVDILCWNLNKEIGQQTTIDYHNLKDGLLPQNAIIDEALEMYRADINASIGL